MNKNNVKAAMVMLLGFLALGIIREVLGVNLDIYPIWKRVTVLSGYAWVGYYVGYLVWRPTTRSN